ncbi:DUF4097 family beta strand repeat-containing protein [Qiania dongpingensis]|uniref:DUF4097 family beta strand repeat protein n=1 Tax=Qiania dongpingensis TaxID=2763669 RepID=A0A7G9G330_9FIRM|nr:DUF4097 family beta strand repeat-containing protein [Qiania dongpingensis]QNM05212.1 DUF4097 family beta strand repeat protein [Qiania dongpingensis]
MKRFTKVCLWICGISFLVGVLMISVSWAMGFRGYHPHDRYDWELVERNQIIEGDIRNVCLKVKAGSIFVEEGDAFAITASTAGEHFKSTVENGTWTLEEAEKHENGTSIGGFYINDDGVYLKSTLGEVHITIPRGVRLEHVEIDVQAGAVEIERISCETMDIDVQAGSADFAADVSKEISAECQAGGVSGFLDGRDEDFNLSIDCNLGSVTVGTYECGGVFNRDNVSYGADKKMSLSCDAGSIEFAFSEND